MPAGRPKITLDDLPENWKAKALTYYESGASDVEIRVHCLGGICHETWERLLAEEPKFSEAIKMGRDMSKAWWESNGRLNLQNKDFSSTLWYMNMKNRFGWADKQQTELTGKDGKDLNWTIKVVE